MISAVPGLLGFTPEASIVIVGLSSHGEATELLGPVVRADLAAESSSQGAAALGRAMYDLPGARASVILVAPVDRQSTGATLDALTAALMVLDEFSIGTFGVHVVDSIRPGAAWRLMHTSDGAGGWGPVRTGTLPAPSESQVLGAGGSSTTDVGATSEQIHRDLDPVTVPELTSRLAPAWFELPVLCPGHEELGVDDVCELVEHFTRLIDNAAGRHGTDVPGARACVREGLCDPAAPKDLAERLAAVCWRRELFQALVVLGVGGHNVTVRAILHEVLVLARGPLRRRALLLVAIMGWCGNYGVLGHRAAIRCLAESRGRSGNDRDLHRGEMLTLSLADSLVAGVGDGTAARLVERIVAEGAGLITARAGLHTRMLDQDGISQVRSALVHRAGR